MSKVNRRDILASFATTALLATKPSFAAVCDIHRTRSGGISTKSYSCQLGEGKRITTTFMRVSDVLADSAGNTQASGDFEQLLEANFLIENDTLSTFNNLMENYSFPYENGQIQVELDGRSTTPQENNRGIFENQTRLRTLGVWDDLRSDELPFFPLPRQLRRAFLEPRGTDATGFLRFAQPSDFDNLERKIQEYISLWQSVKGEIVSLDLLGNLDLLGHIKAGTIDKFLPLYFSSTFSGTCNGSQTGGAYYEPPALFVDFAVCRNEGELPLKIDDFFGAVDKKTELRTYNDSTPPEAVAFGWRPIELKPGESAIATQRLLFGRLPKSNFITTFSREDDVKTDRAVFGATELPKGVIVQGQEFPFDGRSHNALIVGSFYTEGSCPFLMSWCDVACEWVMIGKVLVKSVGRENASEDTHQFPDVRTRFKILEREHERTFLSGLSLVLDFNNGSQITLDNSDCDTVIDIGNSHSESFKIPPHINRSDIVSSSLKIRGYYEKYTQQYVNERREAFLNQQT